MLSPEDMMGAANDSRAIKFPQISAVQESIGLCLSG